MSLSRWSASNGRQPRVVDALVVLLLVVVEVVLPVPVPVELDAVAEVVAADVLVAVSLLDAALVVIVLVRALAAVVMLVPVLLEAVEVVVAGTAAVLVLDVLLVAEPLGRMIRSSMISTSVGRLALVTIDEVVLVVPALVLVARTVPLGVGWGRTLIKTTTLPVGLLFMKLPSWAREVPGPACAALALRRMVVALLAVMLLAVALPVVVALDVVAVAVGPVVALVTVPAAMTVPVAEEKVPIH